MGSYLLFFNSNSDSSAITTTVPASDAEVTFLHLATEADSINFNTTVLTDPRFTSLVDTRTNVIPVPTGRTDPFSQVPGITGN